MSSKVWIDASLISSDSGKRHSFSPCKLSNPDNDTYTSSKQFILVYTVRRNSKNHIIDFDAKVSLKFCQVLNFLIVQNSAGTVILYANGCKESKESMQKWSFAATTVQKSGGMAAVPTILKTAITYNDDNQTSIRWVTMILLERRDKTKRVASKCCGTLCQNGNNFFI